MTATQSGELINVIILADNYTRVAEMPLALSKLLIGTTKTA